MYCVTSAKNRFAKILEIFENFSEIAFLDFDFTEWAGLALSTHILKKLEWIFAKSGALARNRTGATPRVRSFAFYGNGVFYH